MVRIAYRYAYGEGWFIEEMKRIRKHLGQDFIIEEFKGKTDISEYYDTEGANGLWWRKEDCPDNMMDIMKAVRRDWDNYDDAILVMTTRVR